MYVDGNLPNSIQLSNRSLIACVFVVVAARIASRMQPAIESRKGKKASKKAFKMTPNFNYTLRTRAKRASPALLFFNY